MAPLSSCKNLLDVCELVVDCEHKTAPTQSRGYPSIRTPNVGRGHLILDNVNLVSEETYLSWTRRATPSAGDLILAREAPAGNVAIVPENPKVCLGQRTVLIRPDRRQVDPHYLLYLLLEDSMQAKLLSYGAGATVPHVNMSDIRALPLPDLPTLDIQRKIAAILSAYDDLIEVNTRRIALLEEMARGLYREWFVRFRYPGHEGVRMVESAVGTVPEGWEVVVLGDVSDMHRGRSYRTPDLADEGGLPFLNLKCIGRGGGFRYDGVKHYIGEYKPDQTARTGDIVVAVTDMTQERRLVAHAARVHVVDHDFGVMSMDLIRVEPKAEIPKGYLHGLLRFSAFSEEVRQHANGVNVLHLNPAQILAHKFVLPPKSLRDRYAEFCTSIYEQIDILQLKNANLRRTRDLLLPRLVAGEVGVGGGGKDMTTNRPD